MSNSKSAIQEIKSLMVKFGFLAEEPTLLSFKLEDNTILQTEKLEAGNKIVKINDSFEQVALEDGSYRLVENFNVEVSNGEIVAVKEIFLDATLADGTVIKVDIVANALANIVAFGE
jgi:N-acetylglucosamine-6-phosphate deacetylase